MKLLIHAFIIFVKRIFDVKHLLIGSLNEPLRKNKRRVKVNRRKFIDLKLSYDRLPRVQAVHLSRLLIDSKDQSRQKSKLEARQ